MAWIVLTLAGLFEIGWAVGLKYTAGFTRLWPTLWTAASMVVSVVLLGVAMNSLPLGTAYAVWTGIGTIGTAMLRHPAARRAGGRAAARLHRADRVRHHRAEAGDAALSGPARAGA